MGKDPTERISPDIELLDGLQKIRLSPEWKYYLTVLARYKNACMKKAHSHLRAGDDRRASNWLAKADSTDRIVMLMTERIDQLKKDLKGGIE